MRIFVGQGYYDFATPFFAAEYALSRTGIPQDRIEYHYYDAGHMMYVRDEDRSNCRATSGSSFAHAEMKMPRPGRPIRRQSSSDLTQPARLFLPMA